MVEQPVISGVIYRLCGVVQAGLLFFALTASGVSAAQGEGPSFELGVRGLYSSGLSEPYYSYKMDATAGYSAALFEARLGYLRHMRYQLTDGAGNYSYADLNQAHAELACMPVDAFELKAGARCSSGDSSFRGVEYNGELSLYFEMITLSGEIMSAAEKFSMDGQRYTLGRRLYSLDAALTISDAAWIDAGMDYDRIDFKTTDAAYAKSTGRLGAGINRIKPVTVLFGLSYGRDSLEYSLPGADIGFDFRFACGLKASVFYAFTYYQAPSSMSTEAGGWNGGGGGTGYSRDTNPFMRSSLAGTSFAAHGLSVGVSFMF
ncbi:MAG: hypothetical protein KBA15_12915 [Spirochaetes bacterium]|jgi:hypothetical protein|nr:hypothetical protein [Spirochaetota bacterium]